MATLKVGIIDDGYPGMDKNILNFQDINDFIQSEDWGIHESLRELNIGLVKKSLYWKKNIHLKGFRHPEYFMQEADFDYQYLIYDWEYNLSLENKLADDYLLEILQKTKAIVRIYSAWSKYDKIPSMIEDIKFTPYRDRLQLLSKIEYATDLKIADEINSEFEKGESVIWENLKIEIRPSKYLIDSTDFWKFKSLLGAENLISFIKKEASVFDENSVELLFQESKLRFFIDKNKNILSSFKSELLEKGLGVLTEIPPLDALKIFGVDKLEEAVEKGYTEIK